MKIQLLFLFLVVTPLFSQAQDTLTLRDSQEIQLLARRKVEKGLNDLLNTITFDDLGEFERNAIRADSYGDSPNKIFYDNQVIIEDDLNREHDSRATTTDLPVAKYLSNFELFYPQSPDRTVIFTDLRVSNLKKSDYYYVKIYFTSQFTLQHKQIARPYRPIERVAEVRAERKGTKWTTYITRVAFVTPEDQADLTRNDVELAAVVSNPNQENVNLLQEEARNKEREQERKVLAEYNRFLETGDKALAAGELDMALEAYTEAEKRNDYDDLLPRRKLFQVKRALEKAKQTQAELLEGYLKQGALAQKNRKYSEAVGFFKKALDLKPDSLALGESVRILNQKASLKSELDEKYNAGKYKEVIKDYTQLLKKEKENSDHYLGRGLAYFKIDEAKRALADYDKAIALDFANLPSLQARAELYVQKGDIPKAIGDLSSLLNIDPANHEIFNRRAELRIVTRNADGALEDFTKAISLAPINKKYYFQRGLLFDQLGNYNQAIADFTYSLKINEEYSDAWYHRGMVYLKMDQFSKAGEDFARLRILKSTTEQEVKINSIAQQYLDKAKTFYASGDYPATLIDLDKVLSIQPARAEAWYYKANSFLYKADTILALQSFNQAITNDENYTEAYFERGKVLFALSQFSQSAQDFNKAYKLTPTLYHALVGEADSYFSLQRFNQAVPLYETLKLLEKKAIPTVSEIGYARIFNHLGQSYFSLNQIDKAIDEFSRSISKDERFSDAYYNRALAYDMGSNFRRSIPDYKKAVGLDSRNASKYLSLGVACGLNENDQEAIQAYSEAIKRDTLNACCKAISLSNQADIFFKLNQFGLAVENYQESFKYGSELQTPQRRLNLSISLLWLKKPGEALENLEKTNFEDGMLSQVYYTIGCAYAQQFNLESALKWMEKAFLIGTFTNSYIRKDKLLEMCNNSFKNSQEFKVLVNKYVRK